MRYRYARPPGGDDDNDVCVKFAGERPFECSVCHARFTLKHSMMRHRRKHEGVSGADVGDAQSDSDTDSLPNNTGM